MSRARALLGLGAAFSAALALTTCRHDPVPQKVIDSLGEETGEPSATHRPGQPCLACHSTYEGADPPMAIGGTIFYTNNVGEILPAEGVLVRVTDSHQVEKKACTNAVGNFWIERDAWSDARFPMVVRAGGRSMRSFMGRDGSCASCHTLPDDSAIDPVTGASRSSAGVIVVDESDLGESCPSEATGPGTTSASTTSGMGGSTTDTGGGGMGGMGGMTSTTGMGGTGGLGGMGGAGGGSTGTGL